MLSVLRRLSVVLTRFMGVIIIAFSALALWQPWIFSWVAPHISAMLGIIMLGMGMTLHWQDFSHVLRHPRDLGLGLVVQFGCMPLLAFALCHVFALPPELAMGMILVGTAPGGTASNVLTFIARGDVAFSVAMTAAATPPLTWLLGGVWVPVDMGGLFWSIVKIVLVPVLLGLLLHHFQRGLVDRLMPFLPLASALVITLVIAGIIAVNAQNILSAGPAIFAAQPPWPGRRLVRRLPAALCAAAPPRPGHRDRHTEFRAGHSPGAGALHACRRHCRRPVQRLAEHFRRAALQLLGNASRNV